jgi:2-phosphosulfolactate phosphatase
MEIIVDSLLTGAGRATGNVAIIDVFRAFTTAAVALANGAAQIIMVSTVEDALALRDRGAGHLCMGEVGGHAPPGFDFGNSPFAILDVDLTGKTIIQRTSAGTQGVVAATGAKRLYAASLVTAAATARALGCGAPERISLIAMGKGGLHRTDEDELCALHLRNLLEGRRGNPEAVRQLILASGEAERLGDSVPPHIHPEDLDIALDIGCYDFAIRVVLEAGRPVARMERSSVMPGAGGSRDA